MTTNEPPADALRFVAILAGDADAKVHVRLISDVKKDGRLKHEKFGSLRELHPWIAEHNATRYGVFIVINEAPALREGEFVKDKDIVGVRASFIDCDGKRPPKKWHVSPSIVCRRTLDRWHAYWLVDGLRPEQFKEVQKRLALHYGTDKSVSNASRVMRLPGYLHQKNKARPTEYRLESPPDA